MKQGSEGGLAAISRPSLKAMVMVMEQIRTAIVRGKLEQGQRLTEKDLASKLGAEAFRLRTTRQWAVSGESPKAGRPSAPARPSASFHGGRER